MKRKPIILIIVLLVLLTPLWSYLTWLIWPSQDFEVAIVDKDMKAEEAEEHTAITWILNHQKYRKKGVERYSEEDYMERFPEKENLDSVATYADMIYYAEGPGAIMSSSVGSDPNVNTDISESGYPLLEEMFRRRKLVIAEQNALFNSMSSEEKDQMEILFGIDHSGWKGRYFSSLDTTVQEDISPEITQSYKSYTGRDFNFGDVPGIVLKHISGIVLVLQDEEHLDLATPVINTNILLREAYGLPDFLAYLKWFEITFSREEGNVQASYKLHTNNKGDSLLRQYGIPSNFPAIIGDASEGMRYYFCGDFAHTEASENLKYFKGLPQILKVYYNITKPLVENRFFWSYYYPLMKGLLHKGHTRPNLEVERALPETSDYIPYSLEAGNIRLLPKDESTGIYEAEELLEEQGESENNKPVEAGAPAMKKINTINKRGNYVFNRARYKVGGRLPYEVWIAIKEGRSPGNYRSEVSSQGHSRGYVKSEARMWHIVIASLRSEEEAKVYVEKVKDTEVRIVYADQVNSYRILTGSYTELKDAQEQFEKVVRRYPDAWMVLF